jgi:carbamoyltransferase
MYILGINGGLRLGYQDVSAVLMKDGQIVAAVEEERIAREKHAPGRLSEKSIVEVLRIAGISMHEVDVVATHGVTWGEDFENHLKAYFKHRFGHVPKIERHHHHDCHAASAFYAAGHESALAFTADGSGDGFSSRIYDCKDGKMKLLAEFARPHSLGIFYSIITQYCGFVRDSDEYKLMGLAPYGNPERFDLSGVLSASEGRFLLNEDVLRPILPGAPQTTKQEPAYSKALIALFEGVPPLIRGEKPSQHYKDVAASAQSRLEQVMVEVIGYWMKKTGHRNLCLAGGVALNCAANRQLAEQLKLQKLFVQPASSDAGISLGAAYLSSVNNGHSPTRMDSVSLGRSYSEKEIADELDLFGLKYTKEDPALKAAELVADGKVIGWFQGKEEFGPRALGFRSILASASGVEMKSRINAKIKFRESFRPFCPSVLEEDLHLHFVTPLEKLPYMTVNVLVREPEKFPAITHVDGTARVQSVNGDQNPLYHQMLVHLKELTGSGMCVNTSFNRSNEPMAGSPRDAVSIFFGSGLDALVIGPFLLVK